MLPSLDVTFRDEFVHPGDLGGTFSEWHCMVLFGIPKVYWLKVIVGLCEVKCADEKKTRVSLDLLHVALLSCAPAQKCSPVCYLLQELHIHF